MDSSSTSNSATKNALTLTWAFGFNKDIVDGVHSLCADGREALFYVAAHTGVIYDYTKRTQELLQGHCNPIGAVAVSHNKKWVATADAGRDSMMVVWDTASGTPIKSIFNPHPNGVLAMDISADALFIVTLSDPGQSGGDEGTEPQTISLWEWTHPSRKEALFTSAIDEPDIQKMVKFNQSDVRHIITTGEHKTMFWSWEHGGLRGYIPKISRHDFKKGNGVYTSCCFLSGTTQAITATSIGEVVLWDQAHTPRGIRGINGDGSVADNDVVAEEAAQLLCNMPKRQAVKVLKLSDGAITHVSTVSGAIAAAGGEDATSNTGAADLGSAGEGPGAGTKTYVVVASEDGAVRFYDLKFRVEAWFEDLGAGGVTSVSFAAKLPLRPERDSEPAFTVPDFIVGTRRAYAVACEASAFEELDPERRRGSVLLQGMVGSVTCVAAHPLLPRLMVLCDSGDIHLWDYNLKALVIMRSFDAARLRPKCCAFHPQGTLLAVGFSSGACKILDSSDLEEVASFRYTPAPLSAIRFSPDGETVAACDTDNHVLLFKHSMVAAQPQADREESSSSRTPEEEEPQLRDMWTYVGRHRSHGRSITGLEFGTREDGRVSLVSVGEDRSLVEYNLLDSNQETGLLMAEAPRRIEQSGLPTALMWHPLLGSDFEDRLVTANNEYKLKQWNADNKSCRRTTLGPTFGGPINRLEQINHIHADGQSRPSEFVAYGTGDKVVGLVQMPFDGDSHKMMGLIAHPGEITSLSVSGDGNYLATAGGKDLTVNLWKINAQAMQKHATSNTSATNALEMGGGAESKIEQSGTKVMDEMAPFLEQLQGGEGGELHEELMEYFFYALLRTQGEDTTSERSTSNAVPIAEVPNIMRALGYYPTEQEVAHMSNEIKYSTFTETGEVEDSVDLNGVIRLFVNHRPVFPVSKQVIHEAFASMGGDSNDGARMAWSSICAKLQSSGERVSEEELFHCLEALTGDSSNTRINGRQSLYPAQFAEEVLGFEDHRQAHSSALSDGGSLAPSRISRGG